MALYYRKRRLGRGKTWVKLFKEVMQLKNAAQGALWLEKEAISYRKRTGITKQGARVLIRENLAYLAQKFFTSQNAMTQLKKTIGVSRRVYG